jgi:hypothetical protein
MPQATTPWSAAAAVSWQLRRTLRLIARVQAVLASIRRVDFVRIALIAPGRTRNSTQEGRARSYEMHGASKVSTPRIGSRTAIVSSKGTASPVGRGLMLSDPANHGVRERASQSIAGDGSRAALSRVATVRTPAGRVTASTIFAKLRRPQAVGITPEREHSRSSARLRRLSDALNVTGGSRGVTRRPDTEPVGSKRVATYYLLQSAPSTPGLAHSRSRILELPFSRNFIRSHGDRSVERLARPRRIVKIPAPAPALTVASSRQRGAAPGESLVINSTPGIVIHAQAVGDIERQVVEILRRHRETLFEQWQREAQRRQRVEF